MNNPATLVGGIFIFAVGFFLLYKRLQLMLFGKKARGEIIGYATAVPGSRGMSACCYRVRFEFEGKEYISTAMESATIPTGSVPHKNLHREISIYFNPHKPATVTIKEFKATAVIGVLFSALGILTIIASFVI